MSDIWYEKEKDFGNGGSLTRERGSRWDVYGGGSSNGSGGAFSAVGLEQL